MCSSIPCGQAWWLLFWRDHEECTILVCSMELWDVVRSTSGLMKSCYSINANISPTSKCVRHIRPAMTGQNLCSEVSPSSSSNKYRAFTSTHASPDAYIGLYTCLHIRYVSLLHPSRHWSQAGGFVGRKYIVVSRSDRRRFLWRGTPVLLLK